MNLARHAGVLWRFRVITATGILLGTFFAIAASYKLTTDGLVARGSSTFSSRSQILVTQDGFPEGRVVLPTGPVTGSTSDTPKADPERLEFADPARFMALADLYTKLLLSDDVRRRIPERPNEKQIVASPLPAVSGAPILPIIQLDVTAGTAAGATQLNKHVVSALRGLLVEQQNRNDISPGQSVKISTLNAPSTGALTTGPSHTASILVFLLFMIGTVALTHLLESLRPQDPGPAEYDDVVFDFDAEQRRKEQAEEDQPAPAPAPAAWPVPSRAERQ
jgi:hypothetical protein